jgi:hypothetical protein
LLWRDEVAREVASVICAVDGDEGARSGVLPDGEEKIQVASQVVLDVEETSPLARSVVDVEETRQLARSWVRGEKKMQPARSVLSQTERSDHSEKA